MIRILLHACVIQGKLWCMYVCVNVPMRKLFNREIQSKVMRTLVKVIELQATIQCIFMCLKQLLDCRKLVKL